ncbi:hypothetical protein GCM10017771_84680 [Streptomyces capitiformicae]|uniref:Uncharacterized protein n=1 Tax=Streptomyces capitiformicae TaxID=2014920 RepID=A0A918ZPI5_9ACTN|nr:hypothetical protein GCM10017771_84680 [Streptomyces capitiformicae]
MIWASRPGASELSLASEPALADGSGSGVLPAVSSAAMACAIRTSSASDVDESALLAALVDVGVDTSSAPVIAAATAPDKGLATQVPPDESSVDQSHEDRNRTPVSHKKGSPSRRG